MTHRPRCIAYRITAPGVGARCPRHVGKGREAARLCLCPAHSRRLALTLEADLVPPSERRRRALGSWRTELELLANEWRLKCEA
jgi:hypothetical protein